MSFLNLPDNVRYGSFDLPKQIRDNGTGVHNSSIYLYKTDYPNNENSPLGIMEMFKNDLNYIPGHALLLQCFINVFAGNISVSDLPLLFSSARNSQTSSYDFPRLLNAFRNIVMYAPFYDKYPSGNGISSLNLARYGNDQVARAYYDLTRANDYINYVNSPVKVNHESYNTKITYGQYSKTKGKQDLSTIYYNRINLQDVLNEYKKIDPYLYFLNFTPVVDTINNKWLKFDTTELEYLSYKLNINLGIMPHIGMPINDFPIDIPLPVHDAGGNPQIAYRLMLFTFILEKVNNDTIRLKAIEDNNYFYTGSIELPVVTLDTTMVGGKAQSNAAYPDNLRYKDANFIHFNYRPDNSVFYKIVFH